MYDPWADPSPADLRPGRYAVPTPASSEDYPSHVRPDGQPLAVPADLDRHCDDESFERLSQHFEEADLVWGTACRDGRPALALRVDGERFGYGDRITITLLNVLRRRAEVEYEMVGVDGRYDLQVRTESGWTEVRGWRTENRMVGQDLGVTLAHGRGYVWRLELHPDAVIDHETDDRFSVCPRLPTGRYRFVFWGSDPPLGVAFDLVE